MPLYEYHCTRCEHPFEILQAMGASAEDVACPRCDESDVRRALSTFAASTSSGGGGMDLGAASCGPGGFT